MKLTNEQIAMRLRDEIKTGPYAHKSYGDKFWTQVKTASPDQCWMFSGKLFSNGYGDFRCGSRDLLAHKVAYILTNGPYSDYLMICHTCDVRQCVNPSHMFLGTAKDNAQDMVSKHRSNPARGSRSGKTNLTEDDVTLIFEMRVSGATMLSIAEQFHVKEPTISRILSGKRWGYRLHGDGDFR